MEEKQKPKHKQIKLYDQVYEKVEKISSGTYGKVYKVILKKDPSKIYALKMYSNFQEGMDVTALREILILKEISHPNIVKMIDIFYNINSLYVQYEYIDTELSHLIYKMKLEPKHIKNLFYQFLLGLSEIHKNCILHRDLKPQNLLVNNKGILKIADFGLARFISSPGRTMTKNVISDWYRPPEIFFGAKLYSFSIDVWSAGCILGEMALREPLFADNSEIGILTKIFSLLGVPDSSSWADAEQLEHYKLFDNGDVVTIKKKFINFSPLGIDLLEKMIVLDPNKRISIKDALEHPYFNEEPKACSNEEIAQVVKKLKSENKY
jgi:serine/threonine protein kinase